MPGSKPGERRGGRQKGTPNKVTAELRGAAQQYTMQALEVLAHVAQHGESESARVSAACALLDRGHGRPTQGGQCRRGQQLGDSDGADQWAEPRYRAGGPWHRAGR